MSMKKLFIIACIFFMNASFYNLLAQEITDGNTIVGNGAGSAGTFNSFFGCLAGEKNSGSDNTIIGARAGQFISGNFNIGLGTRALGQYHSGDFNIGIGFGAFGWGDEGSHNIAIGNHAGCYFGSNNIFIGNQAGNEEWGSNKLYIENSNNLITPLIFGDFESRQVSINTKPDGIHALTVGGSLNATGIFVNGAPIESGSSLWSTEGNSIYYNGGTVGIGTPLSSNPYGYTLAVNGKIGAKDLRIENNSTTWPDYVFNEEYQLDALSDISRYIKEYGHLKDVPTAKQVEEEGYSQAHLNTVLLKKIEELTLYLIQQDEKIRELESIININ